MPLLRIAAVLLLSSSSVEAQAQACSMLTSSSACQSGRCIWTGSACTAATTRMTTTTTTDSYMFYVLIDDSSPGGPFASCNAAGYFDIRTRAECEEAASYLGLPDTTTTEVGKADLSVKCYHEGAQKRLFWNSIDAATGGYACGEDSRPCICKALCNPWRKDRKGQVYSCSGGAKWQYLLGDTTADLCIKTCEQEVASTGHLCCWFGSFAYKQPSQHKKDCYYRTDGEVSVVIELSNFSGNATSTMCQSPSPTPSPTPPPTKSDTSAPPTPMPTAVPTVKPTLGPTPEPTWAPYFAINEGTCGDLGGENITWMPECEMAAEYLGFAFNKTDTHCVSTTECVSTIKCGWQKICGEDFGGQFDVEEFEFWHDNIVLDINNDSHVTNDELKIWAESNGYNAFTLGKNGTWAADSVFFKNVPYDKSLADVEPNSAAECLWFNPCKPSSTTTTVTTTSTTTECGWQHICGKDFGGQFDVEIPLQFEVWHENADLDLNNDGTVINEELKQWAESKGYNAFTLGKNGTWAADSVFFKNVPYDKSLADVQPNPAAECLWLNTCESTSTTTTVYDTCGNTRPRGCFVEGSYLQVFQDTTAECFFWGTGDTDYWKCVCKTASCTAYTGGCAAGSRNPGDSKLCGTQCDATTCCEPIIYRRIRSGTCAASGLEAILNETECDLAATILGLADTKSSVGNYGSDYAHGCAYGPYLAVNLDLGGACGSNSYDCICEEVRITTDTMQPAAAGKVNLVFSIQNVDFETMTKMHKADMISSITTTVASNACVPESNVKVAISTGSVAVSVTITVPYKMDAATMKSTVDGNQADIAAAVVSDVGAIVRWRKTGTIRVSSFSTTVEDVCSVGDGSSVSSSYPCVCGSASCTKNQICKANRSICEETCPMTQPAIGSACGVITVSCSYGEECCCDQCYSSFTAECTSGRWMGLYTEACINLACNTTGNSSAPLPEAGQAPAPTRAFVPRANGSVLTIPVPFVFLIAALVLIFFST